MFILSYLMRFVIISMAEYGWMDGYPKLTSD